MTITSSPPAKRSHSTRDQAPSHSRSLGSRRAFTGAVFAAPLAIFIVALFLLPLALVGKMSLSDWTLLGGDAGFNQGANFADLVDNPLLWPSVRFTLLYTLIVTAILFPIALGLALVLQESTRWNSFVRTAILLPSAIGLASASLLFGGLYSPAIGPLDSLLKSIGLIDVGSSLLGTPAGSLFATVVLVVWRFTGFNMLLLLIGLQSISDDVYAAAQLDGANRWQTFRDITLPLLRPSLALALIISITGSLLAFDQFFILTRGGPDNSTLTIVQVIYREAFQRFDLGTAAAFSIALLAVLVVLNLAQFRLLRPKDRP